DLQHVPIVDELLLDVAELLLEPIAGHRLAAQPSAADCAAPERQVEPRLLELRQDCLLDLIERHGTAGRMPRCLFEGAGYLPDAVRRKGVAAPLDGIVVDHGFEDERIIGIDPEGHLPRRRPPTIGGGGYVQRCDVTIEPRALALE